MVMREVWTLLSDTSQPIKYDKLFQLANLNQVTPLLYKNLASVQAVPQEIIQRMKTQYILTLQRNAAHLAETLSILDILKRSGVCAIPLKGSFAAEILLGDMGLYPTSDIDILVPWDDLKKARASLIAAGYELSESISEQDQLSSSYHLYFHRDTTTLELHWNLVRRYFDAPPSYWWEDAQEMDFRGMTFFCLSCEKYLLYLIFRFYCKAFMPLHHAVLMLPLLRNGIDWDRFMRFARQLRMRRLVLITLNLMHDAFRLDIPEEITRKKLIGYQFLKRLVISGFFNPDVKLHLRMLLYLSLLDSPYDVLRVFLRRIFPTPAEIRLRYNIPHGSLMILPYYLLNPFVMLFKKTSR